MRDKWPGGLRMSPGMSSGRGRNLRSGQPVQKVETGLNGDQKTGPKDGVTPEDNQKAEPKDEAALEEGLDAGDTTAQETRHGDDQTGRAALGDR